MRSWVRGGSGLLKTETKRKELLKLRNTQRLLKATIDPFRLNFSRDKKRKMKQRK